LRGGRSSTPPPLNARPTPPHPKDEQSTLQLLKKHLLTEQTVENYEETIAQLSRQCRALLELGHPQRLGATLPSPIPPPFPVRKPGSSAFTGRCVPCPANRSAGGSRRLTGCTCL